MIKITLLSTFTKAGAQRTVCTLSSQQGLLPAQSLLPLTPQHSSMAGLCTHLSIHTFHNTPLSPPPNLAARLALGLLLCQSSPGFSLSPDPCVSSMFRWPGPHSPLHKASSKSHTHALHTIHTPVLPVLPPTQPETLLPLCSPKTCMAWTTCHVSTQHPLPWILILPLTSPLLVVSLTPQVQLPLGCHPPPPFNMACPISFTVF
jgi:hypothetical protein